MHLDSYRLKKEDLNALEKIIGNEIKINYRYDNIEDSHNSAKDFSENSDVLPDKIAFFNLSANFKGKSFSLRGTKNWSKLKLVGEKEWVLSKSHELDQFFKKRKTYSWILHNDSLEIFYMFFIGFFLIFGLTKNLYPILIFALVLAGTIYKGKGIYPYSFIDLSERESLLNRIILGVIVGLIAMIILSFLNYIF